jgi:16S rRNA processing protein RimM
VSASNDSLVALGQIAGVFGVKGWLKVRSYTQPRDNIVAFDAWTLRRDGAETRLAVEAGRNHGAGIVAKLEGIDDRDAARQWIGAEVLVERAALPKCAPGEYYWADLEGLEVRTPAGENLGKVDHLLATGGHDVLVVTGRRVRLIPFVPGTVIREVDLEGGVIVADWSPEY